MATRILHFCDNISRQAAGKKKQFKNACNICL